ncbi:hypothetical protein OPT61_g3655 [Boeremia exigua]|uniref:Uncharacterized protein n=1 Tax=Boeremia exigua TaxID=749465 RepID=A0ACC2IH35_9PLEO|nr:hypothetical protein OPT61_g3655 [Boeremia exigua]
MPTARYACGDVLDCCASSAWLGPNAGVESTASKRWLEEWIRVDMGGELEPTSPSSPIEVITALCMHYLDNLTFVRLRHTPNDSRRSRQTSGVYRTRARARRLLGNFTRDPHHRWGSSVPDPPERDSKRDSTPRVKRMLFLDAAVGETVLVRGRGRKAEARPGTPPAWSRPQDRRSRWVQRWRSPGGDGSSTKYHDREVHSINMSEPRVFEGKLAIITGASRSFGAALATHFAARGANVVINYATSASDTLAQDLATHLSSTYNITALPVRADLLNPSAPQHLVDTAKAYFETPSKPFQIDILINNAAIVNAQPIEELDMHLFQQTFDLNVRAPALLIKAAFPYLPHDRSGRIVNISSATTTWGLIQQTSYAGTKGAIEAMTRVWARELAERATVNTVSPGPMDTGLLNGLPEAPREALRLYNALIPLAKERPGVDSEEVLKLAGEIGGRPGTLEEVAGIVGVACLPQSGWMTGNQLGASGGGAFVR